MFVVDESWDRGIRYTQLNASPNISKQFSCSIIVVGFGYSVAQLFSCSVVRLFGYSVIQLLGLSNEHCPSTCSQCRKGVQISCKISPHDTFHLITVRTCCFFLREYIMHTRCPNEPQSSVNTVPVNSYNSYSTNPTVPKMASPYEKCDQSEYHSA